MIGQWLLTLVADLIFQSAASLRRSYYDEITGYMERSGLVGRTDTRHTSGR
jgi:hypothetical protein